MAESNPFHDPARFEEHVPACATVIFGANGDLTRRKLMPALYRLAADKRLPSTFSIIGNSRTPMSHEAFRAEMREAVEKDEKVDEESWGAFAAGLFYSNGDLEDPQTYARIAALLTEINGARPYGGNVLFYLSTQPSYYSQAVALIGAAGIARGEGWRRIVVEKPFGHDLDSSRLLQVELEKVFAERDIYRIDHYLGKETVQNILAMRFGNGIFEPLWNRRYISHVQITAAESIGVEKRGRFYQEVGALRDMVQNHLLQVMATIAMEPPASFEATSVRDERSKLLRSIHVLKPGDVDHNAVAGQYGPARVGADDLAGFRQEDGVDAGADTATYAAATFFVDNWRWAGVPFYVRTGKRLAKHVTDIAIHYHRAPHAVFGAGSGVERRPNLLILRIQPDEGISLRFLSKQPGSGMDLRPVSMDFRYNTSFGERSPSAYETLLLDALIGDATLYTRQDMVDASWRVVQPILEVWANGKFDFPNYAAGSWGPAESDKMLAARGHRWRTP